MPTSPRQVSFYGPGNGSAMTGAIRQDWMMDPRRLLAEQLIQQGGSTAPVQSPMEGLARALQAGVGGYFGGQARKEAQDRQARYGDDMAMVLAGGSARPAINPDTGQPAGQAGGLPGMAAALAKTNNPDMAPFGQQIALQQAAQQQAEADSAAKLRDAMALKAAPGSMNADAPMNIREWNAYQKMTPEEQNRYLTMKRANPYLNIGGEMVQPVPTQPGQIAGSIAKTLAPEDRPETKAAVKAAVDKAEIGVKAVSDLPKVEAEAEYSLKLIDDILDHPGFKGVVGAPDTFGGVAAKIGVPVPGTQEADFTARLDQLGGRQFLQAFETLKGGGQITEVEGKKATQAISRLTQTGQTEKAYREAAEEFRGIIAAGIARARAKAGGAQGGSSSPTTAPIPSEYDWVPGKGLVPRGQ